jgi:prolyl 4-hydroxylase
MTKHADAVEQFAAAMEMLAGRLAMDQVTKAVALLESASAKGNAQASERCALIECMSVVRPQNWDRALDFLQRAAEQGSDSARSQLILLADSASNPEPADGPRARDWAELRSTIHIDERTKAPQPNVVSELPRIRSYSGFATPAECRWLIAIGRGSLGHAPVFDKESGGQTINPVRDNRSVVLQLDTMDVVTEVVRTRISTATRLPVPLFEPSQVLNYAVGQRFKPHHDFLDPANPAYREEIMRSGQRIATFLIYLNDEYEGGQTRFPTLGIDYRGRTGDALFIANVDREGRPEPRTLHAGLPPTAGEKWLLSQWIRDRVPAA